MFLRGRFIDGLAALYTTEGVKYRVYGYITTVL
jgi:hypothetical protein